jgi:hypothetical protein
MSLLPAPSCVKIPSCAPALRLPVFPRQRFRGWPEHPDAKRVPYLPLSEALTRAWDTDAHITAYSAPKKPYRLTADAPKEIGGVPMVAAIFDFDAPKARKSKGYADPDWFTLEQYPRVRELLAAHPGGYCYLSRGGFRVIYRLPEPFLIDGPSSAEAWRKLYLGWCAGLARRFDLLPDPKCSEWQRMYRLPTVTRAPLTTPEPLEAFGSPKEIGAWVYSPDEEEQAENLDVARALAEEHEAWRAVVRHLEPARARRADRVWAVVNPVDFADEEIGRIVSALVPTMGPLPERGGCFRYLCGVMLRRGVPAERLPEIFEALSTSLEEGDSKARERRELARAKAHSFTRGVAIAGYDSLRAEFPEVARALNEVLPGAAGAAAARAEADGRGAEAGLSPAEASEAIDEAIRQREEAGGFGIVKTTEGTGKTARAVAAAIRRAGSGLKTAIATYSHKVASEIATAIEAQGVRVARRQSVLAAKSCRFPSELAALAAGGQNLTTALCRGVGAGKHGGNLPCPHLDTCPAYAAMGRLKDSPALVAVSVVDFLPGLVEFAGEGGLVLIDEDPGSVETVTISAGDLDHAIGAESFNRTDAGVRNVVLRALRAGLEGYVAPEQGAPSNALLAILRRGVERLAGVPSWYQEADRYGFPSTPSEAARILGSFAGHVTYHKNSMGADVRREQWAPYRAGSIARQIHGGMWGADQAEAFERASRTHADVAQAAAGVLGLEGERALCSVEIEGSAAVLRVVRWRAPVSFALRWASEGGRLVLLDATANEPLINALAGRPVPVTEIRVRDGAPVTRIHLHVSHAARKHWLCPGANGSRTLANLGALGPALRAALGEVQNRLQLAAPRVGLISWRPVVEALTRDWRAVGLLWDFVQAGGVLVLPEGGYFGNVRGRNDWIEGEGIDALITLGDDRPNLGAARAVAAALGLSEESDTVYRSLAAASHSQAHGRLRAPRRTRPAVSVHVGGILPVGWGASTVVLGCHVGRPGVSGEELAAAAEEAGSLRGAARVLQLSWGGETGNRIAQAYNENGKHPNSGQVPGELGVGGNRLSKNTSENLFPPGPISAGTKPETEDLQRFGQEARFTLPYLQELVARLGGVTKAAERANIWKSSLFRWHRGDRPAPSGVFWGLEEALAARGEPEPPSAPATAAPKPPKPPPHHHAPRAIPRPELAGNGVQVVNEEKQAGLPIGKSSHGSTSAGVIGASPPMVA